MKVHSIALTICLMISTGCLGAGYILAGYWLLIPAFLALGLYWILSRKQPVFWRASGFLLVYVILAVIGIIAGLSLELMIIACAAALASWDLIQFNQSMAETSLSNTNPSLDKNHLYSLALATSAGLILTFISAYINLQLPFGAIFFLVLAAMGCLLYSTRYLMDRK